MSTSFSSHQTSRHRSLLKRDISSQQQNLLVSWLWKFCKSFRQIAKIVQLFRYGKSAFTDEKYTCERIHTSVGHLQILNILEIWLIITKTWSKGRIILRVRVDFFISSSFAHTERKVVVWQRIFNVRVAWLVKLFDFLGKILPFWATLQNKYWFPAWLKGNKILYSKKGEQKFESCTLMNLFSKMYL